MVTDARTIAESVVDPELPVLTLADLGVLRDVRVTESGSVVVAITPTYTGCPAMEEMRADLRDRLREAGYHDVEIHTVLQPAWTTDWITESGRRKLTENGIAPPGQVRPTPGPIPLTLLPSSSAVDCPHCGSAQTGEISAFGPTACTALRRCSPCQEPFEHVKAV